MKNAAKLFFLLTLAALASTSFAGNHQGGKVGMNSTHAATCYYVRINGRNYLCCAGACYPGP